MKKFIFLLLLFISCTFQKRIQSIYTQHDILYVDYNYMNVTAENENSVLFQADSFTELEDYVSSRTADIVLIYEKLPPKCRVAGNIYNNDDFFYVTKPKECAPDEDLDIHHCCDTIGFLHRNQDNSFTFQNTYLFDSTK